jgi:ribosomal protein S27E
MMTENIIELDDYRPHCTSYVACIECGKDHVVVHLPDTKVMECASCGEIACEIVQPADIDFFKRYMGNAIDLKDRYNRTLVLLNASHMLDVEIFE